MILGGLSTRRDGERFSEWHVLFKFTIRDTDFLWAICAGSLGFECVCVRVAWRADEQANQLKVRVRGLGAIFVVCTRRLCESFCRKWALKCVFDDLIRRGVLLPRGVCEDGAAGGRRSSARRLRRKPTLSSRIRAARGQKFFSKVNVFFSTHCIQVFGSIYGS
jgi:hypothetical protein